MGAKIHFVYSGSAHDMSLSQGHPFDPSVATTQLLTLPHLSIPHTWKWVDIQKNLGLCIIHLTVTLFSFPVRMRGGNTFSCVTPPDENRLSFLSFSSLDKENSFLSVQFNAFCIESSAIYWKGVCCQKMTNCSKYAPKYAITLSISCPVVVFLSCGENGPGQFNLSGLLLISFYGQLLYCLSVCLFFSSFYLIDVFSMHPFFGPWSAAHINTFELSCVKTAWD